MPRSLPATLLAACAALLAACATPGPASVEALRASAAKRLDADEVRTVVTGARVVYTSPDGVTSAWWNNADGALTATQDRTTLMTVSGRGRWRLGEDATYCFVIEWQSGPAHRWFENRCHQLWRLEEAYYGAAPRDAGAQRIARYRFWQPIQHEPVRP